MLTLRAAFRKRLRKAASRPGYGPSRHPQSGKGMGVSGAGGVAKPGWATTKQPIPGGKKIPANNSYAGGHKNVKAAVMKAVRAVAKHKDKQGSTEHHTTHEQRMETPHDHWSAPSAGRERFTHTHGYSLRTHGHPRGVTYAKPKSAPIKKHAEHDQSTHGPYNEEDE
ncbi:hypothetical protein LCGC14_3166580 [marine sediment metagenome]|uniref:Uncharacterized protein n=1 Tax=marine sediment metagenome TaxID=412755 RepID=A0A0F8XRS1_9ZZZZ